MNVSSTLTKLSLFDLNMLIVASPVIRKLPSVPQLSNAFIIIEVKRNGTFSGSCSLCMATSKQSP
eukprot:XP_001706691.1 Hypothetical protein GL50803_8028 [Giardia lamblia ATCC 50803]